MTTGTSTLLVDAFPGGASRPELSRDKKTLAFVRRVRSHEVLVLQYVLCPLERQNHRRALQRLSQWDSTSSFRWPHLRRFCSMGA